MDILETLDELIAAYKHLRGKHDQRAHGHMHSGITTTRYGDSLPKKLYGLASTSLHYDNFEAFEKDYKLKNYHGQYWHLTSDKDFALNKSQTPTDLSSIAGTSSRMGEFGFQVTTDIGNWDETLNPDKKNRLRPYAVEIDLSAGKPGIDYNTTTRGFGHEIYIINPDIVKVKRVVSVPTAERISRDYYDNYLPQSSDDLKEVYDWARANKDTLQAD